VLEQIDTAAHEALERAKKSSRPTSSRVTEGHPVAGLQREIERVSASLVALGSHGGSRPAGILVGGTATTLLHEAPCSVLIARAPADESGFPSAIVVGVDGSGAALLALEAARELGGRLSVPVRALVATGGRAVGLDALRSIDDLEWDDRKPVDALVDASSSADLLIVGSRGLHGLAALGSVSERVAHRATCSVLVVRAPR
jgi:nucleotide-binding universal stress UspA family protein